METIIIVDCMLRTWIDIYIDVIIIYILRLNIYNANNLFVVFY